MADNFEMNDVNTVDGERVPEAQPETTPVTPQQLLLMAVEADVNAKRAKAVANLNVYMNNAGGIGEHPDVAGECITLVQAIAEADGTLETLRRIVQ